MTRFSPTGRQDIALQFDPAQRYSPELYADPALGTTIEPPKTGFWGITMRDKQVNAQIQEPGNFATWIANTLLDPIQKGDQHYVTLGSSMRMHEAAGETLNGWDWLSHKLSPIQNVQGLRQTLEFPDSLWDGEKETLRWMQQPDNAVARAVVLKHTGTELFPMLKATRNREHFEYTIRLKLKEAQALGAMRAFDERSGTALKITSSVASGAANYLLTDPTFLPSLVVPFGGYQQAAGRAGIVTGLRVKRIGQIAARSGSRLVLNAPAKAPSIVKAPALVRGVAKGIIKIGDSPAAMHRGLSTVISHRGAVATEMATLGGVGAHAFQLERMENSEILTDLEAYQDHYRWDEVGLGVGIGAAAGFIFGGNASHRIGRLLEAQSHIAGGGAASPITHSLDNIAGQGVVDYALVRAKRAAQRLLGNDYDSVAVYVADDALLLEAGLDRGHMARLLEGIADTADGPLPANAVHQILADEIAAASKARRGAAGLEDVLGSQIEAEAMANAIARAARENPKAAEATIFDRARALMAEEIAAVTTKLQDRAARAAQRGGSIKSVDFWKQEAADLIEIGKRRDLLRHEMEYLARVDGKLQAAGEKSLLADIIKTRTARYTSGKVSSTLARTGVSKLSRVLKQIRDETAVIEALSKRGIRGKAPERVNAMRRLRAARKRLATFAREQEAVTDPQAVQKNLRAAIAKAAEANPTTAAQKKQVYDELFNSIDAHAGTLMEDQHELSLFLKAVGLGGLVRKLARAGTGVEQTWRSSVAALRFIAQEIDHAKLAVDDLDPTKVGTHRSMQHLLEATHSRVSEFVDIMRKFDNAGEFGNWASNPRQYNRKLVAFNKETIRHISGDVESTNPAVLEAAALWKKHADEIRKIGVDSGVLSEKQVLERFFPRRWDAVSIGKNRKGFRTALSNHFRKNWEESDELHLGTLEAMGHTTREISETGEYVGHALRIDGEDKIVKTLKRSDLAKLDISEDEYLKALRVKNQDGFDPMEVSANRAMRSLSGDDVYETNRKGKLVRKRGEGGPRSEQSRVLEEAVWGDDALEEFLDWRFLENAQGYLRSTGMRVQNAARHQKRIGIRNVTMQDTIDYVDARFTEVLNATEGITDAELKSFKAGIKNLREKVHLAEGRLPSTKETVEGFREWLSDLWVSSAGALFGQGIGSTIVTTELIQSSVARTYGVNDVLRRVIDVAKVGKFLAGEVVRPGRKAFNAELRQQMQTLGLTQRQFRLHALDRLMGESTYNHGFQFGAVHKLLAPWGDVFKTLTGSNNNLGVARRIGEAPVGITRALASNMMQVGGLDFFSTYARLMHVQSSMDEMGRFFKAGEKFAEMLTDPAAQKRLGDLESAAIEKAITAGKSAERANKLGIDARFKAWKGFAREAGFGGNWQVAEKWKRNGMLTVDSMRVIRESGAVLDSGQFKTVDFNALTNHVSATAGGDDIYAGAFESTRGMLQETIRKRVSEQSIIQTPTSEFARSPMGKVANSMTTWTRSFHDNNIMDAAQMPIRVGGAMMTTYMFGEAVNTIMREAWTGKDWDDIVQGIEEDPDNFIARSLTSVPWLGQFGGLTRPAADMLTRNDRMSRIDLGGSASEGAAAAMTDVLFDTIHAATSDEDVSTRTWRTASRFLPGYRTWWGLLANSGLEAVGGPDLIGSQNRSKVERRSPATAATRDAEPLSITTTKPDLPEDLGFLYNQE